MAGGFKKTGGSEGEQLGIVASPLPRPQPQPTPAPKPTTKETKG